MCYRKVKVIVGPTVVVKGGYGLDRFAAVNTGRKGTTVVKNGICV